MRLDTRYLGGGESGENVLPQEMIVGNDDCSINRREPRKTTKSNASS